jgi:FHA domain-containing protein
MSFTCRRGHYSASDDYCDICGARNWSAATGSGSGSAPASGQPGTTRSSAAPAPAPDPYDQPCPVCGTYREGGDRYCPSCAYDFETGETWEMQASPAPLSPVDPWRQVPAAGLMVVVSVDSDRSNDSGCPQAPTDVPERIFMVDQPSMVIGREEASGVHVPIPGDPYVSRKHAELMDLGGQWGLRDLGSTNGTKLNGLALVGTEVRLIRANDVIEVGCFSRITIRERAPQGVGA